MPLPLKLFEISDVVFKDDSKGKFYVYNPVTVTPVTTPVILVNTPVTPISIPSIPVVTPVQTSVFSSLPRRTILPIDMVTGYNCHLYIFHEIICFKNGTHLIHCLKFSVFYVNFCKCKEINMYILHASIWNGILVFVYEFFRCWGQKRTTLVCCEL